jgi:hypothetical protein
MARFRCAVDFDATFAYDPPDLGHPPARARRPGISKLTIAFQEANPDFDAPPTGSCQVARRDDGMEGPVL